MIMIYGRKIKLVGFFQKCKTMKLKEIIGIAGELAKWTLFVGITTGFMSYTYNLYENRTPKVYEKEDKIVIYQGGCRAQLWGEDLDKDGILNNCVYATGIRGGGVFRFQCENPPTEQMRGMFQSLQEDYSAWREER